jgi:hypothetical protein
VRRLALAALLFAACDEEPAPMPDPFFPADFAAVWTEVRDCRQSIDHDLHFILVHANDASAEAYAAGDYPLPEGTVLVKSLFQDDLCTQPDGFASMRKAGGAWEWQKLAADRTVTESGALLQCSSCHASCTEGRDSTCTDP